MGQAPVRPAARGKKQLKKAGGCPAGGKSMKSCENFVSDKSQYFIYSPSKTARDIFLYPLQCGRFLYEPGYYLRRDSYDNFLLMYVQKGEFMLELDGTVSPVAEGDFVLIDCYKQHIYYTDTGCECLWCHFDGITARGYYTNIVSHLGNSFSLPNPQPTVSRLSSIYDTFSTGKAVREALVSKYLTDILTAFLLHSPQKENSPDYTGMAEEIIAYINEHFAEKFSVEELAAKAGLSQYHFIRVFKKETGFTPHEYLNNTRMMTARYLLKNSRLPVKDICFNTGFSSESVFCSAFKKHQGLTPAEYRLLKGSEEAR